MKVQNIVLKGSYKLQILWDLLYDTKVITINIANDSEFTQNSRYLCIPQATSMILDTGVGSWYVRIGVWVSSNPNEGTIEWSGIVGPVTIKTQKPVLPLISPKIKVHYNQSILGGVRLHTGKYENYYAILEYSTGNFEASTTKTLYTFDPSRGYVDVVGLLKYNTYNIRIASFSDEGQIPQDSVKQVCDWTVLKGKKPTILPKPLNSTDLTIQKADQALLQDTGEKRTIRFTSGTERTNYLAAKARMQSALQKN